MLIDPANRLGETRQSPWPGNVRELRNISRQIHDSQSRNSLALPPMLQKLLLVMSSWKTRSICPWDRLIWLRSRTVTQFRRPRVTPVESASQTGRRIDDRRRTTGPVSGTSGALNRRPPPRYRVPPLQRVEESYYRLATELTDGEIQAALMPIMGMFGRLPLPSKFAARPSNAT